MSTAPSQKWPRRKRTSDAYLQSGSSDHPHFKHNEKGWCCIHRGFIGRGDTVYQALSAYAEAVGAQIGFVDYRAMLSR